MEDGFIVKWDHVNAFAQRKNTSSWFQSCNSCYKNQILENVSGIAYPGRMLAILGPIGSGKTALLNYLAGDVSPYLKYTGKVLLNDRKAVMILNSQYIKQTDTFHRLITVEEHLIFHAKMHYGQKYKSKNIDQKIKILLDKFDLSSNKNSVITEVEHVKKSLSGGERRLLTIATALIKKSKIIFADSPFAGLDADMSLKVASCFKNFATDGGTVICSLNQPSIATYDVFDDVLLLFDGYSAYVGLKTNLSVTFNKMGFSIDESNENSYSKYLDLMCELKYEQRKEPRNIMAAITSNVPNSEIKVFNSRMKSPKNPNFFLFYLWNYKADPFTQFGVLFERSIKVFFRNPLVPIARLLQDLILSILLGLLYYKIKFQLSNSTVVAGLFFFEMTGILLNATIVAIPTFSTDYKIQRYESKIHLYRSSVYYLAKTLCEFPLQLVTNSIFAAIIFYMIEMRKPAIHFGWHWLFVLLNYQCSFSYGYLISAISGDNLVTAALLIPFLLPLIIFGGFLLPKKELPRYLTWVGKLSWFQYVFNNAEINNFYNRPFDPRKEMSSTSISQYGQGPAFGNVVLRVLGVDVNDFNKNIGILFGLIFGYKAVGLLFFVIRTFFATNLRT